MFGELFGESFGEPLTPTDLILLLHCIICQSKDMSVMVRAHMLAVMTVTVGTEVIPLFVGDADTDSSGGLLHLSPHYGANIEIMRMCAFCFAIN